MAKKGQKGGETTEGGGDETKPRVKKKKHLFNKIRKPPVFPEVSQNSKDRKIRKVKKKLGPRLKVKRKGLKRNPSLALSLGKTPPKIGKKLRRKSVKVSSSLSMDKSDSEKLVKSNNTILSITSSNKGKETKSKCWNSLVHQGPSFPPEYKKLPLAVKFFYNKKSVCLSPEAEEAAVHYAKMYPIYKGMTYGAKKNFNDNFFNDWKETMTSTEKNLIREMKLCDFRKIRQYVAGEAFKVKGFGESNPQSLEPIKRNDVASLDDEFQAVLNYKITSPGIFMSKKRHPKNGCYSRRISASDITINCSEGKIPIPPSGLGKWGKVVSEKSVLWLARWKDPVLGTYVYMRPDQELMKTSESDRQMFEKARKMKKVIGQIRSEYTKDFMHNDEYRRQLSTAFYLIDRLALRVGTENVDDEESLGILSLRCKNVLLHCHSTSAAVTLKYLPKGNEKGRPYKNRVEILFPVYFNLRKFTSEKDDENFVFHLLTGPSLNSYMKRIFSGTNSRILRALNASMALIQSLIDVRKEVNKDPEFRGTVEEHLYEYNRARMGAKRICNHTRDISCKNYELYIKKIEKRITEAKETINTLREKIKLIDPDPVQEISLRRVELNARLYKLLTQVAKLEMKKETLALGRDEDNLKLNYFDPRITVAWCLINEVPINRIWSSVEEKRHCWAIRRTDFTFVF